MPPRPDATAMQTRSEPQTTSDRRSPSLITPEAAAELGIPGDVAAATAGRPGLTLLRSRAATAVDGYATPVAGWGDLAGQDETAAAEVEAAAEPLTEAGPDDVTPSPNRAPLGPEASVLRREPMPRTASAPKPIAAPPSQPLPKPSPISSDTVAAKPAEATGDDDAAEAVPSPSPASTGQPTVAETDAEEDEEAHIVPEDTPTLAIDPASFRGVLPGKSTREELLAGWGEGEAFTREDGSNGLFWKVEPFERVEVVLEGDTVSSIFIRLNQPVPVAELSRQLEISDLRTVTVLDENGVSIGEAFPERGVVFSVTPGTHAAVAVMLEPLDAESFVLRAESDLEVSAANSLADLQYAVKIDPSHVRAHRLLMVILADQGKWRQAAEVGEAASRLDPADSWTQVKLASILLALDRVEDAHDRVEKLLARKNNPPLVTAQAERLLGRLELAQSSPDHEKAVTHFGKAIKLSAPLTTAKSQAVRRAALDLQLDSHLGTALAIASGSWQQKARVLPKWIERSEGFAKKLGSEVGTTDMVELRLCEGVLAVAAKSNDVAETVPWVKRAMDARSRLGERVADPWRRRQIDWQVGQTLNLALTAAQNRGEADDLLGNATLTAAYLEGGSQLRQLTPREQRMLGDLYFRIGILHSLQNGDHATAVTWFDKTVPLWKENPSFERTGDLGRLGESYVSMAISYWQVEKRPEAVTLSRLGVECMVDAVERKQLDERALAVAYGNLSTMYAEQGDAEQSKAYAEMASRAESTGTVIK
jgi:tetratricopeptide (TPR) repeat protein